MTDEATAAINLANVAGCDHSMYLMVWDIDDFKQVNDTYGHYFGDEVIKHLATELNRAVANRGLVGRIGGDEFLVLLKEANGEDTLRSLLKAVRKKLKVDLAQEKPDYEFSASIGISQYGKMERIMKHCLKSQTVHCILPKKREKTGLSYMIRKNTDIC